MTMNPRVGSVGGKGWLGNAVAAAAVASRFVDPSRLTLSGRSDNRGATDIPGAHWTKDNAELADRSDVIVLSVRPDQFPGVGIHARGKLVISVMAGVPARVIAGQTQAGQVVRSLPNAAASIRKSFTPWFAMPPVSMENKRLVQALLETCGAACEVQEESHIDYCVGMTGSGAAFPALLAQAMIEHAVAQGLPPAFARRAAQGVLVHASQLLAEHDDPAPILEAMIAYRGTTAAALGAMVDRGFKTAVAAGLEAAAAKAAAMAAS